MVKRANQPLKSSFDAHYGLIRGEYSFSGKQKNLLVLVSSFILIQLLLITELEWSDLHNLYIKPSRENSLLIQMFGPITNSLVYLNSNLVFE